MAVHIHPLDLPPKYYKPIGQIAALWNVAEAEIQSILWHFHKIRSPHVGRLFTFRPTSVEKLKMFKVTAERYITDTTVKSSMNSLHKEAEYLRGRRNTFIHGLWGRMPKEPKTWKVFFIKDTDDTYTLKREVITPADLKALASRIRQLASNLRRFRQNIGAPPP